MNRLNKKIIQCEQCPRLREWCRSQEGAKKEFASEHYWKLPLPGFGDQNGRILITGLAPAAHGGNRTGRVFTGDTSGKYLFAALYRNGFSNQAESISSSDGLVLKDVYITNVVKCAPPQNKPSAGEFHACSPFLLEEIEQLKNIKTILALGGQAFAKTKRVLKSRGADVSDMTFGHNVMYKTDGGFPLLAASYHPSLYNINTRRVTPAMLDDVFNKVKSFL